MKKLIPFVAVVLLLLSVPAAWAEKPEVPTSDIYLGAWTRYTEGIWTVEDRKEMILTRERQIGRKYAIDNQYFRFEMRWWEDPENMIDWDLANGRIPLISWDCPGPDEEGRTGSQRIVEGLLDQQIDDWAAAIRARREPVFLRYCWEMEGKWQRYSAGDPEDFVASWRRMWGRFNRVVDGVRANDYVAWVWTSRTWDFDIPEGVEWATSFYPGDAYVDWIGADGYNWYDCRNQWRGFVTIFGPWYEWASTRPKPLMVPEMGTTEDDAREGRKAKWISGAARRLKEDFPKIRAAVYFDTFGRKGCAWRLGTSKESLAAWRQMASDPYFQAGMP